MHDNIEQELFATLSQIIQAAQEVSKAANANSGKVDPILLEAVIVRTEFIQKQVEFAQNELRRCCLGEEDIEL